MLLAVVAIMCIVPCVSGQSAHGSGPFRSISEDETEAPVVVTTGSRSAAPELTNTPVPLIDPVESSSSPTEPLESPAPPATTVPVAAMSSPSTRLSPEPLVEESVAPVGPLNTASVDDVPVGPTATPVPSTSASLSPLVPPRMVVKKAADSGSDFADNSTGKAKAGDISRLQEMVIVCILGSVAAIGIVVAAISRKIYQQSEFSDDEAFSPARSGMRTIGGPVRKRETA